MAREPEKRVSRGGETRLAALAELCGLACANELAGEAEALAEAERG